MRKLPEFPAITRPRRPNPLLRLGTLLRGMSSGDGLYLISAQFSGCRPGAFVMRSPTFGVLLFYRTLDPDQAKGEALAKRIRTYPWAARDNPPATRFLKPDLSTFAKFTTMPRGMKYWEQLANIIQREPVEDRDRFFMAMLMPLGIEKGKPFQPDARQTKILTEGAFVGEAMAKALAFDARVPGALYRPDANWSYYLLLDPMQDLANYSQFDERAGYIYTGLSVTKAMITKTPGIGQAYLGSFRDKEGNAFDGAKSYHLHVPPNPPAKQFWSVTLYDVDTRSIVLNNEHNAVRGSGDDLVKNADGSVDLYFLRPHRRVWRKTGFRPCLDRRGSRLSDSTRR